MQAQFKSKAFWAGIFGAVVFLIEVCLKLAGVGFDSGQLDLIVSAAATVTALGCTIWGVISTHGNTTQLLTEIGNTVSDTGTINSGGAESFNLDPGCNDTGQDK